MPLPGPGSCAELTGPLLGCWRKKRGGREGGAGVGLAMLGPVGKRERLKTTWGKREDGRGGGSANNTALIIPWMSARMFLCLL